MSDIAYRDRRDPEGFCIYRHVCRLNGKSYVGLTEYGAERRWTQHVRFARLGASSFFHRAIRKYGPGTFDHEILERAATRANANDAEARWVLHFKSDMPEFGYNIDPGGNTSERRADTKVLIGAVQRKRWALMTDEAKSSAGRRTNAFMSPEQRSVAFLANWTALTLKEQTEQVERLRLSRTTEERSATMRRLRAAETPDQMRTRQERKAASTTAEQRSDAGRKRAATLGDAGLKEVGLKIAAAWAAKTPSEKQEITARQQASTTPESRSAAAFRAAAAQTPEARSERTKKMNASFSPEQRSEIARKREVAKRAKREAKK